MLIEQIIEFELKLNWAQAPSKSNSIMHLLVHVLLQLLIFMKKQKSVMQIFEWIIIYC